jgi:hypothetical protein
LKAVINTIESYYTFFAKNLNLSLLQNGVEMDFDAIRWSCQSLELSGRDSLVFWLRRIKTEYPNVVDAFLFRAVKDSLAYEPRCDGLLFNGLQDGSLSAENIRDVGLYMSTLDIQKREKGDVNGDIVGKRSVSLPGLTQSWDSMVQTSSSLFSALSFGTVPARRSPLATPPETPRDTSKVNPLEVTDDGRWIIGGDTEGKKIWLETGGEHPVPISLGNERPGFLREISGQESPDEDRVMELEISVYKVIHLYFSLTNS